MSYRPAEGLLPLVGNVESGAPCPDWKIRLVPLFLGIATRVILERLLVLEFHGERVTMIALSFNGPSPNAGHSVEFLGNGLYTIKGFFDLLIRGVVLLSGRLE